MRVRTVSIGLTLLAAVVFLACGDDGGTRRGFETNTRPEDSAANLPDAGDGADTRFDAGKEPRPPFDPADEPVVCSSDAGACAVELVAGRNHFCARMSDGTVRCWGDERFGAVGQRPAGSAEHAVRSVGSLVGVTQLSAAGSTTCARLDDGTVSCWGDNRAGQLALPSDALEHPVPSMVALKEAALRVDVGPRVVCASLASGKPWCWGDNQQMQLTTPSSGVLPPTEIALGPFAVAKTSIGTTTTLGLTTQGDLTTWGAVNGRMGLLGGRVASITPDGEPVPVEQLHAVTSFAASATLERDEEGCLGTVTPPPAPPGGAPPHAHACAIAAGEVYCWGRSDFGALCTGFLDTERLPRHAPITGKAWPQKIAVGDEVTCARMTDGSIQCCGADHRGRLGAGFTPTFAPVAAFEGHAVQVATSHRAICALLRDGSVECWGNNEYGELGRSTHDKDVHPTPMKVAL